MTATEAALRPPAGAGGRRLAWRPAEVVERVAETRRASTLVLDVPGWPGHLAGQHVDVRLTAEGCHAHGHAGSPKCVTLRPYGAGTGLEARDRATISLADRNPSAA